MKMFTMSGESDLNDVFEVVNKHYQKDADLKLHFHEEEEAFIPITVIEKQTTVKKKVKIHFIYIYHIYFIKSHL